MIESTFGIKIDKSVREELTCRNDVRRRLRAFSCEKSSISTDPNENFAVFLAFLLFFER